MRSFATGGASRATGGRPGDDDGHDPFGDCTSSGWEGTEGADADADAAGGSTARTHATHDDGWEANFEDLMAMEDSYGSGVEDLSTAAMEMANARMAEQKRLQEEMRRLRGINRETGSACGSGTGAVPGSHQAVPLHIAVRGAGLGHDPSARNQPQQQQHQQPPTTTTSTTRAAAAASGRGIASKGDAATGTTRETLGGGRSWWRSATSCARAGTGSG